MNSNFVSLSKVSDDTVVEKILDEWFVKKINLFLYFGGSGKKCRLSRCISPSLHIGGEQVITNGDEFYLSEESDAHSILKFIPDLPLTSHLTITKGFKISRSIRGEYFNYEYSGSALGYWVVVPTQISAFNNGNYLLTDKKSFSLKAGLSGAVYIYSVYDEDYLIFEDDSFVSNNDLYIDIKVLDSFLPLFDSKQSKHVDFILEKSLSSKFLTSKYNIALYLMMKKLVVRSGDTPVVSKFKLDYDEMWKGNVSESTLCEWFEKPELYIEKRQRLTPEKKKGLYLFLTLFIKKEGIKNTKEKASVIAEKLNELALQEYQLDEVIFTANHVKPWLEKPLS
ncbi:hypothetical protein RZR38_09355 [Citrobacter freundii]|uniref:hypothetical protein n=1 Tax=Enterobacterales TaxID=91347 RepID=UPI000B8E6B6F|nr:MULTISPECIES: hypothetical protein [Enterobacteriaceae]HBU6572743.1 hypothetical protein [Citrobacter amalonaticus]HEF7238428.1 hypothetical protein [Yersinia enterocolitica]MCM7575632.1 hypothetical protein [Enterobacter kobei]MDU7222131.1 hypothetical protein [Citrobacter freundii]MDV1855965.1 hypothetical protein [Citrobacter freundii]